MMTSQTSESEAVVLESLLPSLEAEGFRVLLHPSRSMLPSFMHAHQPDAIALKRDRKVAIEVISKSPRSGAKIRQMQEAFSDHPEWEFRVVYAPRRLADMAITTPAEGVLQSVLGKLPKVMEEGGPVPAILTAWSAFEAASRALLPTDMERPQPAERLVEMLASDGYITPDDADSVRKLAVLRNKAAHGGFDIALTAVDLRTFVRVIQSVLDQLPKSTLEGRRHAL